MTYLHLMFVAIASLVTAHLMNYVSDTDLYIGFIISFQICLFNELQEIKNDLRIRIQ